MKLITCLAFGTALATASLAAPAKSLTYTVDAHHSFPLFEIHHMGYSTFRGRFEGVSGKITLDDDKHSGSAEIHIDVKSVSTGVKKLDDELTAQDFFDAGKYPEIVFKSRKFKFDGDTLKSVEGKLTMHGVTRPVTLDVANFHCATHPMLQVPACGADASVTIKRSDWGLTKWINYNVSDEVKLELEVEAQAIKGGGGRP